MKTASVLKEVFIVCTWDEQKHILLLVGLPRTPSLSSYHLALLGSILNPLGMDFTLPGWLRIL